MSFLFFSLSAPSHVPPQRNANRERFSQPPGE
jgi:hypothetical protein